jgi:hypothetical protein
MVAAVSEHVVGDPGSHALSKWHDTTCFGACDRRSATDRFGFR